MMNHFIDFTRNSVWSPMYPPGTTLLLLLTGIFLILVGWKKIGVFLVVAGGVVLFAFSLNWTGLTLLHSLEAEAGPYADPATLRAAGVKYIVVLGGDSPGWPRLLEGIRLWREMPNTKLVLSVSAPGSAEAMAALPVSLGVPRDALIIVTKALHTAGEAELIKPIVGREPFALVTSAYHIPRAVQLFRLEGATPIPCPCQFSNIHLSRYQLFVPRFRNLAFSRVALHEYYGRLFYGIKGLVFGSF